MLNRILTEMNEYNNLVRTVEPHGGSVLLSCEHTPWTLLSFFLFILFLAVLGIEPKTSCMLSTWATFPWILLIIAISLLIRRSHLLQLFDGLCFKKMKKTLGKRNIVEEGSVWYPRSNSSLLFYLIIFDRIELGVQQRLV